VFYVRMLVCIYVLVMILVIFVIVIKTCMRGGLGLTMGRTGWKFGITDGMMRVMERVLRSYETQWYKGNIISAD